MAENPTRREAMVRIAAGAAASSALAPLTLQAQSSYQPQNLSPPQFELLTVLVDMIIPQSDTPGASAAGVHELIDEALGPAGENRKTMATGLDALVQAGFSAMDEAARVKLLGEYSEAADERGEFFRVLKDMTIDGYYTTEIGLVQELGYKGNTYLGAFPGCQHEEPH